MVSDEEISFEQGYCERLAAHRAQQQMDGLRHSGLAGRGYKQRTRDVAIFSHRWGWV